jgi:hypothetical protein
MTAHRSQHDKALSSRPVPGHTFIFALDMFIHLVDHASLLVPKSREALVSIVFIASACPSVRNFINSFHKATSIVLTASHWVSTVAKTVRPSSFVRANHWRTPALSQPSASAPLTLGPGIDSGVSSWPFWDPMDFNGPRCRPLSSKLLWTVISLDAESDPSLYALSPMHAPIWPF